jgi:CHAT domain-containing protein
VIANPAFDGGGAAASEQGARPAESVEARRSGSLTDTAFTPLPGTKGEASALGTIMAGARVFTEMGASEAMLKRASAPSVLHVATHGFFLPDQVKADAGDAGGLEVRGVGLTRQKAEGENPLLRSGIALAGANRRQGGAGEDRVLTALEAAGLDLWGTKLVVLSACETGVGEVKNGEGVYGLRRALVLAGSESQVMSLWQVSDEATRDLMVGYYKRLQAGEGRTEALRNVQLAMIKSGATEGASGPTRGMQSAGALKATDRSHPFYWAAFIQSGDWRSMNGKAGGAK